MSVTVSDLLKLPSLRQAKVIAGHGGLSKVVSSISVLESTDPGVLVDEVFPQGEYYGSEIVITGFLNMMDNVEQQYINMKRLAEGGEVGLILFYVGIYLKEIHPRIRCLADEMDFVLIVMPEGDPTLRYGEVISDVTSLIYQNRSRQDSLVSEILAQVTPLPTHQRSVPTILKMLSDRLSASVLLCDSAFKPLLIAAWPRSLEESIRAGLESLDALPPDQGTMPCSILPEGFLSRYTISPDHGPKLELLLFKEGLPLEPSLLEQAMEVMQLGVNIWGQEQEEVAARELIRAILQDKPIKMRQLADLFHINVADIHEMWILDCEEQKRERFRREGLPFLREYLDHYCHTVVADFYEGYLVVFLDWIEQAPERKSISQELQAQLETMDFSTILTCCHPLERTAEVRQSFLIYVEMLPFARKIWPLQNCYTLQDMKFAADCHRKAEEGETVLTQSLAPLRPLLDSQADPLLLQTLETYLLDAKSSTVGCSRLLFLHKNTVKYRRGRIRTLLGCDRDSMPQVYPLYRAAALLRLTGGP